MAGTDHGILNAEQKARFERGEWPVPRQYHPVGQEAAKMNAMNAQQTALGGSSSAPDKLRGEIICDDLAHRSAMLLNLITAIECKLFGPRPASDREQQTGQGVMGLIEMSGDILAEANSRLESIISGLGGR